ncbi:RNA-directed DNA polymerase from mobile element jockey [Frankliniella fusca]|uniref:RNA-directed DNA polymerase from mobile element jockey n=1 Tax=Frankliniella fusca TaxID=407009 RepID=A0AAE1LQ63_9NEOP|nr:RNA-directed DNA polymerase from mobile element jockey [Frankliniella fusca]
MVPSKKLSLLMANSQRNMSLMTWNVNETHFNNNPVITPPKGYAMYKKDRLEKKKGGVAILIKTDIDHATEDIDTNTAESVTISHCEKYSGTTIAGNKRIYLTSLYCPPNMKVKKPDIFKLPVQKTNFIIAGDLNAKNNSWGHRTTNYYGKWFEELCEVNDLTLHVPEEPTRNANSCTDIEDILDYVITGTNIKLSLKVLKEEFNTSDHIPILILIEDIKITNISTNYFRTRWERVIAEIDRPYHTTKDNNYDVRHLTAVLQCAILNNSYNMKKGRKHNIKITPEIKTLITLKRKADLNYAKTRSHGDKREQRKLKKKLNKAIKIQEEEEKLKNIFNLNDPLLRWQTLKKGKPTPPPIPTLKKNNDIAKTMQQKAELLAHTLEEKFQEYPSPQDATITQKVKNHIDELRTTRPTNTTDQPDWITLLLQNYYNNRQFYVKVHNKTSTIHPIRAGTAQGAVLSPTLYSLYISDMPTVQGINTYQYADDTLYLASTDHPQSTIDIMNNQLKDLQTWCSNWKTKINASKSVALPLTGFKRTRDIQLIYDNQEIETRTTIKYLGITLDTKLTFTTHITNILETGRIKTASLRQYLQKKKITTVKTRIILHKTLIQPTMTYGLPAWSTATKPQLDKLRHVEKGWAKYVQYLPILTSSEEVLRNMPFSPTFDDYLRSSIGKFFLFSRHHSNPLIKNILVTTKPSKHQYPIDATLILEDLIAHIDNEEDNDRLTYLQRLKDTIIT